MSAVYCSSTPPLYVKKQRINALIHQGEAVGQLVLSTDTCINAIKIDRIKPKLLERTVHLFNNKVIIRGIIRKEVFFVDPDNRVRFLQEEVPFSLVVEFPGLKPNGKLEVQTYLLDARVDFSLHPARFCLPGLLRQTIVAHILVVVAEKRQLEIVTKVDYER